MRSTLNKPANLNGTAARYTMYLFHCKETHANEHDCSTVWPVACTDRRPHELNCWLSNNV